ncbi:MAG: M48 family metallopeptidase, partial [Rhodocyclaceae bacterium]|nr:M48 family metallopeptidase [Rhodocyclaceae bacterium]
MLRQLVSNLPSTVCSLAGMLLAAALVAGCSTNPMTGRSQLMLVTEQSAIAQSASHYQAMMGSLEKNGKISTDEALNARVQDITDRLVNQAVRYRPDTRAWAWTVKVIDAPETLNAFCMPGGRMAIFSGMMTRLDASDDEIAQVMGHEIAHALANHGAEKMSVAMAANLAVVAVAAAGRNNSQRVGLYNAATLAALAFINLPNSRQAETEADKLGVELAARAGYDPHAAVTLWSKMLQQKGGRAAPDFLSTHPSTDKRIA